MSVVFSFLTKTNWEHYSVNFNIRLFSIGFVPFVPEVGK